jgi:hypothetical protein
MASLSKPRVQQRSIVQSQSCTNPTAYTQTFLEISVLGLLLLAGGSTWTNRAAVVESISAIYPSLALRKSNGRLVSNSKCLHCVFPDFCPTKGQTEHSS